MKFEVTSKSLAALLTEAKAEHSNLPANYPAHEWEDWYADYIIGRLLQTSHVEACEVCSVAFGHVPVNAALDSPGYPLSDSMRCDKLRANIGTVNEAPSSWFNGCEDGHVHTRLCLAILAIVIYAFMFVYMIGA